jgi:hypothetical protein
VQTPRYTYKTHAMLTAAWGIPFEVAGVPLSFEGFANYIGTKGKNEFGGGTAPRNQYRHADHVRHERRRHAPKNTFKVGVEYQYWKTSSAIRTPTTQVQPPRRLWCAPNTTFLSRLNFKGNRRMKRRTLLA